MGETLELGRVEDPLRQTRDPDGTVDGVIFWEATVRKSRGSI
jgi:hypothetical protein